MENDLQAELELGRNMLPRIDGLYLQEILQSREGALMNAVRRVLRSLDEDQDNYAAHGSSPAPRTDVY